MENILPVPKKRLSRHVHLFNSLPWLKGKTALIICTGTPLNVVFICFCSGIFQFSVLESSQTGTPVGRIRATDKDIGENAEMFFTIASGDGMDMFDISTDQATQEGVISVSKVGEWTQDVSTFVKSSLSFNLFFTNYEQLAHWLTKKEISKRN